MPNAVNCYKFPVCYIVPCQKHKGRLSPTRHFHILEMTIRSRYNMFKTSKCEPNKNVEKGAGHERKSDVRIYLCETFSKVALLLSNVLTFHSFTLSGLGRVAEISYTMLNFLLYNAHLDRNQIQRYVAWISLVKLNSTVSTDVFIMHIIYDMSIKILTRPNTLLINGCPNICNSCQFSKFHPAFIQVCVLSVYV